MTLNGRVALVTGASRGIGRAAALALAAEGASVAVNYRSSHDQAAAVVKEIEHRGGRAIAIAADVSEPAEAAALVERAKQELGGLHVLVNNAGISRDGLIFDLDVDEAWRVLKVNFGGVLNCTRAAVAHLMSQRDGSIVNVSSVMAEGGWTGESSYAASKGAINAFTLCSAVEFARFGVRVNAVLPGFTPTDLVGPLLDRDKGKGLLRQVPMRAFADVEQIAKVIAFVAGPGASYMTGALLRVDGGFGAQLGIGRIG
jgi:3-oxoacyl-[acyl-carrier protein] reductase